MEQFCRQPRRSFRCPFCAFARSWRLRRDHRKCKRCRREWSSRWLVKGFRADQARWQIVIRAFLRERTGSRVAAVAHLERHVVHRMLLHLREIMARDLPAPFAGTVEIDDTFIGGQWRNQPWSIRRWGTKRGRGTSKQPILGLIHRRSGTAFVVFVPNLRERILAP